MNQTNLRILTLITAAAALIESATARSAVISMDFHQPGDALLTYDTINHRQWLDLSQTGGWSLAQTKQALLPGGIYYDFHVATVSDVAEFVDSAGYDAASTAGETNFTIATELIDLLNQDLWYITTYTTVGSPFDRFYPTGSWSQKLRFADAWASSNPGFAPFDDFTIYTVQTGSTDATPDDPSPIRFDDSTAISFAGTQPNDPSSFTYPARGFWLFRDVPVPEPAPIAMLITSCTPLLLNGRYRRNVSR